MDFDVTVQKQKQSAVAYCFLRVRDNWPNAVIVADDGKSIIRRASRRLGGVHEGVFYQDADKYLAASLFSCPVPRVQFTVEGDKLKIVGADGGESLAEKLATLPFWTHKVSSARLKAIS